MDLASLVAAHMAAMPRPIPAVSQPQGRVHPTKYETRQVNGKWVLVPTKFARGKADPRLTPKVSYTPYP